MPGFGSQLPGNLELSPSLSYLSQVWSAKAARLVHNTRAPSTLGAFVQSFIHSLVLLSVCRLEQRAPVKTAYASLPPNEGLPPASLTASSLGFGRPPAAWGLVASASRAELRPPRRCRRRRSSRSCSQSSRVDLAASEIVNLLLDACRIFAPARERHLTLALSLSLSLSLSHPHSLFLSLTISLLLCTPTTLMK